SSRQDAPSRYRVAVPVARSALPRERFSPLALLRHSKIGGLRAFGGRAGAADIAGDAPELAVERRRGSYSPFLLSPAIGQRAGELCEGEIGRRGTIDQCRDDPG